MSVKFHLPGLRYLFPLNFFFADMMKQYPHYFRDDVEIASFYGEFPTSLWNGGRFSNNDQCDANFIRMVIRSINELGIAVRYTYTNPCLVEADLKDDYCNFCLKAADNGKNEVLVVSPILEEYIRKNYPNFKINSSTCKEIRTMEGLNEELAKDYHLVVLDYNFNNQFEQLTQIQDKERCEILVNPCCVPNCPRRGEHYRYLAAQQEIALNNRKLPKGRQIPYEPWYCEYEDKASLYTIQKYSTFISADQLWDTYVPMGFSNFKIEGRTADLLMMMDTYCYYMMKPECRDEGRMLLLWNLEQKHVVNVGRPKPTAWNKNQ